MFESRRQPEYRDLPVGHGKMVHLLVLPTSHPSVLISAEEIKKPFIKHGAFLIRRHRAGLNSEVFWEVFNKGYYSAVRAKTVHIPASYDCEEGNIEVTQEVLDEAVGLTWCTVSSSPEEQKKRYELLMRALAKWRRPRLEIKLLAINTIIEASTLFDRDGRFNPTSRSPMVLSAALRYRRRRDEIVQIRHGIHGQLAALILEKNRVWKFLDEIDRMLRQSQSRWRNGCPPSKFVAAGHARRFRDAIQFLDEPYVAPFGRRTLRRLKGDFERIAAALESGQYDQAFKRIKTARNSIVMARRRGFMEEDLLKLTQLIKSKADRLTPSEQGDFLIAFMEFVIMFAEPDLEEGFENKVSVTVLKFLDLAIKEVVKETPDLRLLRDHFKNACEPI